MNISTRASKFAKFLGIKQKLPRMPALGRRELAVLELFWATKKPSLSVADVQQTMQQETSEVSESISNNTLQSTLERLYRKELLHREKQGRAFFYRAACVKKDIIKRLLHDMAADMTNGDIAPMISGFMEYVGSQDPDLSARLGQALDEPPSTDD